MTTLKTKKITLTLLLID